MFSTHDSVMMLQLRFLPTDNTRWFSGGGGGGGGIATIASLCSHLIISRLAGENQQAIGLHADIYFSDLKNASFT